MIRADKLRVPEIGEGRDVSILLGLMVIAGVFVAALTAPLGTLVGSSIWAIYGALHGLVAFTFFVASVIGIYVGYRLYQGSFTDLFELKALTALTSLLSALTIFFGNWVYVGYRAPEGPRSWLVENAPAVHKVFMEFKEFAALFTFPLALVAAYIVWSYRDEVLKRPALRTTVAVLLFLVFLYFMTAFGLGAAITKVKSV